MVGVGGLAAVSAPRLGGMRTERGERAVFRQEGGKPEEQGRRIAQAAGVGGEPVERGARAEGDRPRLRAVGGETEGQAELAVDVDGEVHERISLCRVDLVLVSVDGGREEAFGGLEFPGARTRSRAA